VLLTGDGSNSAETATKRTTTRSSGEIMTEFNLWRDQGIADGIRTRLRFEDRLATGYLALTIMLWYLVQIGVVFLGGDKAFIQWMFTTQSFPALSPGLFFSIISHAFPPRLTHLFGNVAMLWLFGGECEQHLGKVELVGFFVVTSLASVSLGTAVSGQNTLGASGGILAFVGFYCVHMVGTHREVFDFETLTEAGSMGLRTYWGVILALTPIVLILYSVGQIIGLLPVSRTDAIGHLTGVLCGIGYAFIRSRI